MDALLGGRLVERDACLYVTSGGGTETIPPIWPHGFSYERGRGDVLVLDEEGNRVSRTGKPIEMSGGLLPKRFVPEDAGDCRGPFWLVGDLSTTRQRSRH